MHFCSASRALGSCLPGPSETRYRNLADCLNACKTTFCPSRRLFRRLRILAVNPLGLTSSMGYPKNAPSSFRAAESTPGCRFLGGLRMKGCDTFTSFRPWVFSTLRRLSPPQRCQDIAPDFRSWGSPRFRLLRNSLSRDADLPFEAFPPSVATTALSFLLATVGERHRVEPFGSPRSPPLLALPFLFDRGCFHSRPH